MRNFLLAGLLAMVGPAGAEQACMSLEADSPWISLVEAPTEDERVLSATRSATPRQTLCVDPVLTSSGLDVVTESQFILLLRVVIGPTGKIERFQILREPPLNIDFVGPLRLALARWRFEAPEQGAAICTVVAITKSMGARASEHCKTREVRQTEDRFHQRPGDELVPPTSGGLDEADQGFMTP